MLAFNGLNELLYHLVHPEVFYIFFLTFNLPTIILTAIINAVSWAATHWLRWMAKWLRSWK